MFADEVSSISGLKYRSEGSGLGMEVTIDSKLFSRPVHAVMGMLGEFQAQNAAIASLAVKTILPELSEATIEQGLSQAKLPGRFEIIQDVPGYPNVSPLILDGAHTVNSVSHIMQTFRELYGDGKSKCFHLLYASAADKDVEDIAPVFSGLFTKIMLTRPGETKACDMPRLEKAFSAAGMEFTSCADFVKAIATALEDAQNDRALLLVTGSFYLVSEVKKFLLAKRCNLI